MSNNADLPHMAVPDYQSLMLPVLRNCADSQEHELSDVRQRIAEDLSLTAADLSERLPTGKDSVFRNRVAWAVQYLKAAGAVEAVRRGVYRITARGMALLEENPAGLNLTDLSRFPEFSSFWGRTVEDEGIIEPEPVESKDTPEEAMNRSFRYHQDALAEELLETIKNGSPAAFEKLVVELLGAMGYGTDASGCGRVVGKSGDGGIDGEIDQDKLGLETIYIQAKRWADVVPSPEIMKFSGSLTKKHASKGVFITSSGFTRDAMEYVRALPQKIVLIDGKKLAALMIEHNVGVAQDKTYTLKRLDSNYFDTLC